MSSKDTPNSVIEQGRAALSVLRVSRWKAVLKTCRHLLITIGLNFFIAIGLAVIPISLVITIFSVWLFSTPTCITTSEKKLIDLNGLDFEISTTGCWGTAESKIAVARHGQKQKTLLFEYDPIARAGLPVISMPSKNEIIISVSEVGAVYARRRDWEEMHIDYKIEKNICPRKRTSCLVNEGGGLIFRRAFARLNPRQQV